MYLPNYIIYYGNIVFGLNDDPILCLELPYVFYAYGDENAKSTEEYVSSLSPRKVCYEHDITHELRKVVFALDKEASKYFIECVADCTAKLYCKNEQTRVLSTQLTVVNEYREIGEQQYVSDRLDITIGPNDDDAYVPNAGISIPVILGRAVV